MHNFHPFPLQIHFHMDFHSTEGLYRWVFISIAFQADQNWSFFNSTRLVFASIPADLYIKQSRLRLGAWLKICWGNPISSRLQNINHLSRANSKQYDHCQLPWLGLTYIRTRTSIVLSVGLRRSIVCGWIEHGPRSVRGIMFFQPTIRLSNNLSGSSVLISGGARG